MKRIVLYLLCLSLLGCSSSDSSEAIAEDLIENPISEDTSPSRSQLFRLFLKKFKILSLPLEIRSDDYASIEVTGLERLNEQSYDTLFAKADYFNESFCYGMLPDTTLFYTLIFYHPAAEYYPVLATYSKSGFLINQENLFHGACGSDCGLTSCSMTGIISKDLSVLSVDSIYYEYECDSTYAPLPNTGEIIVISKKGKIDKKGAISMSEKKEQRIKTNP
ncbi:hypothetical protein Q4E40_16090 [Pontibacter sp. BT731]|uniref:hypothetical protein n=1 Tax=Pontibacter coccineus TaxID=3063328 RepID=UPI0026E2EBE1|nr:hypothetical protein [Pontibacter sp. BT731]MDO6391656.1 hypothetical protein [Pontibacter sp. BT731]